MGNKTIETDSDVAAFLAAVEPPERREDGERLVALMQTVSGQPPRLWGSSIIGFGSYHYRYDSGREGDASRIAFSPRKAELVLYLSGLADEDCVPLGKHKRGKGCLYIKRLSGIDMAVLEALIVQSWNHMESAYPA
ncbi:DUF1801 domain-containing protein [Sphingobium terrigena]|uniref:DUF1801 domain-containing protein n=1 Tax=Sphingobium terrigena TaxID=2304063 RepID=A0A418YXT5_9SPHN|nr:DUF1801 domain-containing protein [Sphingobium terrigena]RJG57691.1 DUF1801 domain-containing protein [Sphingobium terrigena]